MDRSSDAGLVETARIRTDECRGGQNNWKVHEGHTLRCELADVVALRLDTDVSHSPGPAATSERLVLLQTVARQMDDELQRAGWRSSRTRRVGGDLGRLRQTLADGTSPRLIVQVSLPYFED
jgi:hypothetical protein